MIYAGTIVDTVDSKLSSIIMICSIWHNANLLKFHCWFVTANVNKSPGDSIHPFPSTYSVCRKQLSMQCTLDIKHSFVYNRYKTNCQRDIHNLSDAAEPCVCQNNMEETSVIMSVNGRVKKFSRKYATDASNNCPIT